MTFDFLVPHLLTRSNSLDHYLSIYLTPRIFNSFNLSIIFIHIFTQFITTRHHHQPPCLHSDLPHSVSCPAPPHPTSEIVNHHPIRTPMPLPSNPPNNPQPHLKLPLRNQIPRRQRQCPLDPTVERRFHSTPNPPTLHPDLPMFHPTCQIQILPRHRMRFRPFRLRLRLLSQKRISWRGGYQSWRSR